MGFKGKKNRERETVGREEEEEKLRKKMEGSRIAGSIFMIFLSMKTTQ